MKKIKSITTTKYEIELFEDKKFYRIIYSRTGQNPTMSEKFKDYRSCEYSFDLKLIELEGN